MQCNIYTLLLLKEQMRIQRIMRFYEQFYANQFDNLEEMKVSLKVTVKSDSRRNWKSEYPYTYYRNVFVS